MSTPSTSIAKTTKTTLASLRKAHGDDEIRIRMAELRAYLAAGNLETEILEKTSWSHDELVVLRQAVISVELLDLKAPPEEVFITYMLKQEGCVRDLNDLVEFWKGKNRNAQAVVGAIKAKSDIIDRVLERGQDLGVLKRAAKKTEVVGGIVVASLSDRRLKELVTEELNKITGLGEKYKDVELVEAVPVTTATTSANRAPSLSAAAAHAKKRIAGRGADRARAARSKTRSGIEVQRQKATAPPPA